MKVMAISFALLFSLPLISALDFQITSPDYFEIDENLSVSISAETSEIYDVKIFVQNQESKTISEIYNDGWKTPYYYIKESFPNRKEYSIRIIKEADNYELCTRLRKTGKATYTQECKFLSSSEQEVQDSQPQESNDSEQNNTSKIESTTIEPIEPTKLEKNDSETTENNISSDPPINQEIENKKITLNSPQNNEQEVLVTKQEKTRLWAIYAFTIFCIIIIILLALRKL